jgi:hypothetical protein
VKDAVLGMKNDIELLEQLNKELLPEDLTMEQIKGVHQTRKKHTWDTVNAKGMT